MTVSCLFKKSEGDELGNISEDVKAQINECSEKKNTKRFIVQRILLRKT